MQTNTHAEFQRKIGKSRWHHADSRKQRWVNKQQKLKELVQDLTEEIKGQKEASEATLGKRVKEGLKGRTRVLK